MNQTNVRAFAPSVNPSPEDVALWLKQKAERGEIAANSARLKITAVRQLASILAGDEPQTASYLLAEISSIATRWATLNSDGAKGDTAKTYESRARAAIEDYFSWKEDPKGFKFRRREPVGKGDAPRKANVRAKQAPTPPPVPPPAPEVRRFENPADGQAYTFPLGSDREPFRFVLPADGITVSDVRKIICNLLTLATDFDPLVPSHAQAFSIVAQREQTTKAGQG